MNKHKLIFAVLLGVVLALPVAAFEGDGDEIVARVNGVEITRAYLKSIERSLYTRTAHLPPHERNEIVLRRAINSTLAAQEAERHGLHDDKEVQKRFSYLMREILEDAYVMRLAAQRVTDKHINDYYARESGDMPRVNEVHARHILLRSRDEAVRVVQELQRGGSFNTLARRYSIDKPTAGGGGDLGYFRAETMIPEFARAAFALAVGEVSRPVETEYGWHIIKVEDKRYRPPLPLPEMRERIEKVLMRQARREIYEDLRRNAQIEIMSR